MLITRAALIFFNMLFSFNECKKIINLIANFFIGKENLVLQCPLTTLKIIRYRRTLCQSALIL